MPARVRCWELVLKCSRVQPVPAVLTPTGHAGRRRGGKSNEEPRGAGPGREQNASLDSGSRFCEEIWSRAKACPEIAAQGFPGTAFQQGQKRLILCPLVANTQGQHYSGLTMRRSGRSQSAVQGVLEVICKENTALPTSLMCDSNEPH